MSLFESKFKVLSLFSGIGAIDKGLEDSGFFETVAFCEKDKHCKKVLNKHWPLLPIFDDVEKLDIPSLQGEGIYNIDVIVGGFPCQDISFAGAQKGILKGERSSLWKEYFRLIKEIGPKYVIIENVEHLRKNGLGIVLRDLSSIGHTVEWTVLTAEAFGLPHKRERLFIVSYPGSIRLDERIREERYLQINQERESEEIHSDREKCEPKFIEIRKIFPDGSVESFMSSHPCKKSFVSSVHRVTDGLESKLDEDRRRQRIKQLGNSVVPIIATYIGKQISDYEARKLL